VPLRDIVLASLAPTLWGLAFVAVKIGLGTFTAAELVALRFLLAATPALMLPRPPIGWAMLVLIGLFLFTGQFMGLFLGIQLGMPTGLASVVAQTQSFFTVLFAAIALGERPTGRQLLGMTVALGGLGLLALTVGADFTAIGFALTLAGAVSWGIGNVLVKRLGRVDMLALMAWASLVPVAVSVVVSGALEGFGSFLERSSHLTWATAVSVLYLGCVATVFTYVVWAKLLARYSAAMVAPFTLLIPFAGALSSTVVFGERFGPIRLLAMALVVGGVAIVLAPRRRAA
jgi:O-acetylserine/cysteine efflux transporter